MNAAGVGARERTVKSARALASARCVCSVCILSIFRVVRWCRLKAGAGKKMPELLQTHATL